jgi:hypothetical protein
MKSFFFVRFVNMLRFAWIIAGMGGSVANHVKTSESFVALDSLLHG